MALNSIVSWLMKKRIHQIELFIKYPHEVQQETFEQLIHAAENTEWGKKFGYGDIKSPDQFKQRVPVQSYESLSPYIDRLMKGEQNLLWPSEIKWFAKSSGTTSARSKYIPVSREALEDCHYKGGKDLVACYYNNNSEAAPYSGKTLSMGGSSTINEFRSDSYTGDLSAIILKNLPIWAELKRIPDKNTALLENWEEKIARMAETTRKQDVSTLIGVPSWTLVLLRRILEMEGKTDIREVWPNLELFMHGGVSFKPYESQYQSIISGKIHYYQSYNASEGYFGIQDQNDSENMLLTLDYGIYYEFMPMNELGKEFPKTHSLDEVETGTNYALIISTNAGLWRYMIGDTIKFTSLSPYRIQVSGRTKHFINAFGEELIIENAEEALQRACAATGASISDYTAGPVYMSSDKASGHEWLIEFAIPPADAEEFTDLLDQGLKEVNSDYDAKRSSDLSMGRPLVHVVPEGTFYNWLKKKNKLGGQHKIPRLSNDREYLDEILEQVLENIRTT